MKQLSATKMQSQVVNKKILQGEWGSRHKVCNSAEKELEMEKKQQAYGGLSSASSSSSHL